MGSVANRDDYYLQKGQLHNQQVTQPWTVTMWDAPWSFSGKSARVPLCQHQIMAR